MKTYLVTGGAGFIGSHFVRCLHNSESGASVVNVDKLTYSGRIENLSEMKTSERHEFYKGDICDEEFMRSVLETHRPDAVVNFAAESHVDRSIENSRDFIRTNIDGVRNLLDLSVEYGVKKFLQVSTDEVYGPIKAGSFDEEACLSPRNPYAASKASGDLIALSYWHTHRLPVVVTRSANNFGENQHEEKLIPKIITNALSLKKIPIYGDGRQLREWIYVEDNCNAIMALLGAFKPGEVYNISSGYETENIELARRIIRSISVKLEKGDPRTEKIGEALLEFVDDRKGHDFRYSVDCEKIRKRTGWKPEYGFEEAIERTVDWHLRNDGLRGERHADSI